MTRTLAARLALWGVDGTTEGAAGEPGMLLNFIERLGQAQPQPVPAASAAELAARRGPLQQRVRRSLGLDPWPERTALAPQCVGIIERAGFRIEKLVYEAWPGLPVTAHLYLPADASGPLPGLVYACGHWMESGKLAEPIQAFCSSTARLGIATLVYDPIGQGERLGSWRDHGHLNALLVGSSQLGLMVWESIRALDYLAGRPEVDPARIGITGASGGGLNTLFTAAVEDRFACVLPAAYPCTFWLSMTAERDLNWEDGTDVCNQVPGVMSYADMADLASLCIPRPYMILSGTRDAIFPIAGARAAAEAVARNYALAGVAERFGFCERDEVHGYQKSLREAAYGWLSRWLLGRSDGSPLPEEPAERIAIPYTVTYQDPPEPQPGHVRDQSPTAVPHPDALIGFCRPADDPVRSEPRIDELLRARADALPPPPAVPARPADLEAWQESVRARIQGVLGDFPARSPLRTRLYNQVWADGLMAERIVFESEPGIRVPAVFVMPEAWQRPVPFVIYAGEWGRREGLENGLLQDLVERGYGVLALDVRGVGESAATDFEAATNALMMNRPLFGQRVWDLIRAVDCLWERVYIAPQVDKGRLVVAGDGVGGLLALYACALDGRLAGAIARGVPATYRALLPHGARFPASAYLFDVLAQYDVAQVVGACAPRPVWLSTLDGWRRPVSSGEAAPALAPAAAAFRTAAAPQDWLHIEPADAGQDLADWLDRVLH